ncbi:hypothetical protein LCGC14_1290950 [marine sediment metagenome]|uniref:Uncharacterized protein n=1 Tax=marine sediment metagenome TaxID=412755 RepID=A0A0F9KU23_9ZZZZ
MEHNRPKVCTDACINDEVLRLKAQLDEAVELLNQHCHSHYFSNCGNESCGNCTVCNSLSFVAKHKEDSHGK